MTSGIETTAPITLREAAGHYASSDAAGVPLHLLPAGAVPDGLLSDGERRWSETVGFKGGAKAQVLIPAPDGTVAAALIGGGNGEAGEPCGPSDLLLGQAAGSLPAGTYRLGSGFSRAELAALAWGLGAYRYRRYKSAAADTAPPRIAQLALPDTVDRARLLNMVEAVWLGRDLINTPASDLGPAEIEAAVRAVAAVHGASVRAVVGDDLLTQNFPMIHAVGRASPRPPRLIELDWSKPGGRPDAPTVTLVGKGITFDTGGLDIKPASAMLIMKKDMGGAAVALAVAHMIMGQGLDVRLKLLIASAENAVSGDAFRPGDVLKSRAGLTVEIGNTDAEGRLVLADALALADETGPDSIFVFATLTGAARTALGPDLPALFTNDDALAARLQSTGAAIGDPVWRLPLWPGYDGNLDSNVADLNNVWESPFAGSITAALFLKRFVKNARRFAHFDLYGWRPAPRPLGPKGGEVQTARAVLEVLRAESEGVA
jgi:leucyl aminopeptidase